LSLHDLKGLTAIIIQAGMDLIFGETVLL